MTHPGAEMWDPSAFSTGTSRTYFPCAYFSQKLGAVATQGVTSISPFPHTATSVLGVGLSVGLLLSGSV